MKFLSALKKKKIERQFFLALLLKPYNVGAILFEKADNNLVLLSHKETPLNKMIDEVTTEHLIQATDEVISFVEGSLPPGEQVEQTIFAIPRDWQDEGKIRKDIQPRFKQLCTDLSLVPIGFLVFIEAIIHAIQKKEGVPTSAVFIEVAHKQILVYLVRNGAVIQVVSSTAGHDSIVQTVESLLLQIDSVDVLPPKIILLDYEGAEQIQQEFLSHDWNKELPFLHLPQVVVLEKGFENEAVINGVATQMESHVTHDFKSTATAEQEVEHSNLSIPIGQPEDFGFVKNVDIRSEESLRQDEGDENIDDELQEDTEKRAIEMENIEPVSVASIHAADRSEPAGTEYEKEDDSDKTHHNEPVYHDTLFTRLQGLHPMAVLKKLFASKDSLIATPGSIIKKFSWRTWGIIVLLLIILGGGIYAYYTQYLTAEVIVFTDRRFVDASESVTMSSDSITSASAKSIKVEIITVTAEGSESTETTGKKETGEKAKGEVTVYNKTEKSKEFSKGTKITANNINFVLLDDVKVASTSSFSTSFSNAKVKIEAEKFGKEYNLPSGTNFTVDGLPAADYFAKNDSAFSGGTKKEIRVVSSADRTDLEESILKTLTQKAKQQSQTEASDEKFLLPEPLSYEFSEKKFSKKEGDEANELTLNASIEYKLGLYTRQDLITLVEELSREDVPKGYLLKESESDIKVEDVKIDDDEQATGTLNIHAVYMPRLDLATISKNVTSKGVFEAEQTVRNVPGVTDVKVMMNPIPGLPKFLPFSTKNIKVTIKSEN